MKNKVVLLTALVLVFSSAGFTQSEAASIMSGSEPAHALSLPETQSVEQLAKTVAEAWSEGKLSGLDARRTYLGTVRVVVEDMCGEPARVRRKTFRTLAQVDRWFKGSERADGPGRNIGTLKDCNKGVCTFEPEGVTHNNLYLKKITYGMSKGKPYIKAIYIDDGC